MFKSHRLLLLTNGSAVGVFVHSLSYVYIIISEDGAFVQITDTNIDGGGRPTVHLTRFVPTEYKPFVTTLLFFRNRHSCKPYCAEAFYGDQSELYCGDHTTRWRAEDGGGARARELHVGQWRRVQSEQDRLVNIVSKVSICPLNKRVCFDTLTTYYTESILGTDNLKEEKCTLVPLQFSVANCPADLKGLALALLGSPTPSQASAQQLNQKQEAGSGAPELADVQRVGPDTVLVTNSVASGPLGATNSSAALEVFGVLVSELTLLRDISRYPSCDGTAYTLVEQLDACPDSAERGVEGGAMLSPFQHGRGAQWLGCTFVHSSDAASSPPVASHAAKDAAWRLKVLQGTRVEAWLNETRVREGFIGGVISVHADMVHFQLYATSAHSCLSHSINENERKGETNGSSQHPEVPAIDCDGTADVGTTDLSSRRDGLDFLDFTVHVCLFESFMHDDYDDDYEEDEEGGKGGWMSWGKLTGASMHSLTHVELALHYKQVVLHLISLKEQIYEFSVCYALGEVTTRSMGLVYGRSMQQSSYSSSSPILRGSKSLEMYHPHLPRQLQFQVARDTCDGRTESKQSNELQSPGLSPRCCGEVVSTSRDGNGNCFTLMGDGSTRGVFRKEAMIMLHLPDLQVVRAILGDGSERVLSVPMLLQMATLPAPTACSSATNPADSPMLEAVSRNLLQLLAFRRYAVLPEDRDRSQLFFKEKSVSVAVTIAQMRNSNYLKKNSIHKK